MRFKLLGTAAAEAIPGIWCSCEFCAKAIELGGKDIRRRCGTLIDDTLLIDISPDIYMHKLTHGLNLFNIPHILLSHAHEDHFDVDELAMAVTPVFARRNTPVIHLYGNEACFARFEKRGLTEYADQLKFHIVKAGDTFFAGEYGVTALPADHNPLENCLLYYIEKDGRTFLYGHDSGYYPESVFDFLKGKRLHAAEMDCVLGLHELRINHMGFPACRDVRERLIAQGSADDSTQFVLTHFTHNAANSHAELVAGTEKYGFIVGYDGLEINI